MTIFPVGIRFTVAPEQTEPLHDALEHLRAVDIEAPSKELAEHYANEIRGALERQAG